MWGWINFVLFMLLCLAVWYIPKDSISAIICQQGNCDWQCHVSQQKSTSYSLIFSQSHKGLKKIVNLLCYLKLNHSHSKSFIYFWRLAELHIIRNTKLKEAGTKWTSPVNMMMIIIFLRSIGVTVDDILSRCSMFCNLWIIADTCYLKC